MIYIDQWTFSCIFAAFPSIPRSHRAVSREINSWQSLSWLIVEVVQDLWVVYVTLDTMYHDTTTRFNSDRGVLIDNEHSYLLLDYRYCYIFQRNLVPRNKFPHISSEWVITKCQIKRIDQNYIGTAKDSHYNTLEDMLSYLI